ncbi:MAG: preprotein translocase subunit SecG [Gammaproteobacteria bacterium]|jgi:preprotein translocase subunit SecG
MENLNSILLIAQVILSISLIVLVLIQHGKGADAGAAFGSGASSTVFGSRGSGNFLTKATAVIATCFFIVCMGLAYMASHREGPQSILQSITNSGAVQGSTILQSDLPLADESTGNTAGDDLPPAD